MDSKNFKDAMKVCRELEIGELLYFNQKIYTDEPDDLKYYYEWVTAISLQIIRKDKNHYKICYN